MCRLVFVSWFKIVLTRKGRGIEDKTRPSVGVVKRVVVDHSYRPRGGTKVKTEGRGGCCHQGWLRGDHHAWSCRLPKLTVVQCVRLEDLETIVVVS